MQRATLPTAFALALLLGAFAAQPASAVQGCKKDKDAICPFIFAPVVCDNGKTYSNQCFATADCATGCVPADEPTASPAAAGGECKNSGILCPTVYDPVICNDGQVYSNACFARQACAHGCKAFEVTP
jgi:hypothetical protein